METAARPKTPEERVHHSEVERVLTKLCIAMTTGDGHAAARLWEVPAYVLGDKMVKPIATADELTSFFGGGREEYNKLGIVETRPEILEEDWIGDNVVRVRVRWPYLDANKREIGAESSDYTLARDDHGKLRLRVAVMRGTEPRTS